MNRLTAMLAGTTLVCASASAYLWHEERSGRERAAALEQRVKELEGTLAAAPTSASVRRSPFSMTGEPALPATAAERTPARAVNGTIAPGVSQSTAPASMVGLIASPMVAATDRSKLMEDPEYRAAMRSQLRMVMASQYPDLAEALNLQPEEVDKLLDLLTDQQMAMMNRQPSFMTDGKIDRNALQDWQKQMQQQQRDGEAKIADALGSAKVQEWKDYQKTLGARHQVKQLRSMMEGSSEPLRSDQIQSLVSVVATEQQRRMSEAQVTFTPATARSTTSSDRLSMMEQSVEQTVQSNQRMHDAAAAYLTPRQLQQFDQMINQQVEMQRVNVRMMRARADAEARGEVQPENYATNSLVTAYGESRP